MKFIDDIPKTQFDEFVLHHPYKSHFLQTTAWGDFCNKTKKVIPHYIGIENDKKELIAAALLLEKKLPLGYSYCYSPRGFVLDFNNKDLIATFTKELKKYMKKNKIIFTKVDPDIKLQDLDNNGNVINKEKNNYELIDYLQKLGYKHLGFNKNFEHNEPRYTFRLDIKDKTLDELLANMHPTTRNILKRGNPFNLEIIKGTKDNLNDFCITMNETGKRQDAVFATQEYYKEFYNYLNKKGMSDIFLIKVNIKNLKSIYKEKIKELEDKIKSPSKKNKDLNDQLDKLKKELTQINSIKEKDLPLSSMITVKYNNKVWTVHGGNHSKLRQLNANYLLYYEIIKDAVANNYEMVDFFGTTGSQDKHNPVYGIHLFKKRLGGEYLEFIGEFDLISKKFLYFIFQTLIPIRHKLQRRKYQKENHNQHKEEA